MNLPHQVKPKNIVRKEKLRFQAHLVKKRDANIIWIWVYQLLQHK